MASSSVSSIVRDILAVFSDGLGILARPKEKKHMKRKKPMKMNEDELKLCNSLENRPNEIKAEYAQSVEKHGKRFEQGDSKAYSDLAQTLLILNTGLINLINHSLSLATADLSKSRQNLLLLSESAAASTLCALSQLDLRLTLSPASRSGQSQPHKGEKKLKHPLAQGPPIRPGPNPLLTRGGWVRSKSGSSVVSAATARKLMDRDGRHKRSQSSSALTVVAQTPHSKMTVPHYAENRHNLEQAKFGLVSSQTEGKISEPPLLSNGPAEKADRAPSMVIVPADYFDSLVSDEEKMPPPRPPKVPLHTRPNPKMRPRPVSGATFMTASTKIGEIPEHKWPDQGQGDEIQCLPLPYVIPPPLESPQRERRGLRFWKRTERPKHLLTA